MSYGFNRFLEGRRFIKHQFERKMRNAMDGSALHIVVNNEESLEVLRPMSKNCQRGGVLTIRTAQGCMNPMSGSIQDP